MTRSKAVTRTADISRAILVLRGHRVLLDEALAELYGVTTKRFNEQVRRNAARFPADFMFQLTVEEREALRSHSGDGLRISVEGMAIAGHGGSQANERGCPKQQRGWVGASTAAAQHFSNQAAHGLDSIGGERQA